MSGRGGFHLGTIRLLVTHLKGHPLIEGAERVRKKAAALYLSSSVRTIALSGDRDGGVQSWRRGWRAGSALALRLGVGRVWKSIPFL